MHIATLSVLDDAGAEVWTGSALEFIRANDMTRDDVAEMVATLRGVPGEPPQPYTVGGGAAALFHVHLVERAPEVERCPHCDAANTPEYFYCIACGRRPLTEDQLGLIELGSWVRETRGSHRADPSNAYLREEYRLARALFIDTKALVRSGGAA